MTTEPTDTHKCSPAAEPLALSSSAVLGPTPPLVERLRDWADDTYELQAGELPDVRRDLAAAADEIERLRAALRLYVDAGFGNSTDHFKQGAAYDAAVEALGPNEY